MSPNPSRPDLPDFALAPAAQQVQQEVARLAASPEVRSAFNWFRTQEPQLAMADGNGADSGASVW